MSFWTDPGASFSALDPTTRRGAINLFSGGTSEAASHVSDSLSRYGDNVGKSLAGGIRHAAQEAPHIAPYVGAYILGDYAFGGAGAAGGATADTTATTTPYVSGAMSGTAVDGTTLGAGSSALGTGSAAGTDAAGNVFDANGNVISSVGANFNTAAPVASSAAGNVAAPAAANTLAPAAGSAGMSTGQEIALGLSGLNTISALTHARQKPVNTDPYGTGAAAAATSKALLDKYNNGQLMPGDQSSIATYQQQETARVNDYYARAGLSNSSMAQQAIQQVGVQAQAMRQTALTNMFNAAMSGAQVSSQYVANMVQQQITQDQAMTAAQQDFMSTMMQYGNYSSGTNYKAPGQP